MNIIDKCVALLLEFDTNKTWVNPKTGNHVGYYRALQLGLIKPGEERGKDKEVSHTTPKVPTLKKAVKGHMTGPRPKKDPNAPKAWWAHLTKYKLNAYPVNIPEDQVKQDFTGDINSHFVLSWVNPKTGKVTRAYTKAFLKKNADLKWKRLLKIKPKDINHIQQTADKVLNNPSADDRLKQAAAVISIISHTGLRVGSIQGFEETGNRGVSTLSPENITIIGNKIRFNFTGKSYQENEAEINDAALAKYLLLKKVEKKGSPLLFSINKGYIDEVYDKYMKMERFKIKDLRTYVANKVAKEILYKDPSTPPPLPENQKEIKELVKGKLKSVFEKVSEILNNTPTMARTSYIHPQIIHTWLDSIGVKAEFVGYKESIQLREDEFDDAITTQNTEESSIEDNFDDVDIYELPEWWNSDEWILVKSNDSKKITEKLEQLTGKKVILTEATSVSSGKLKPGDIVESPSRGKYIILDYPRMGRVWYEFPVIHFSDVENVLKDPNTISVATWKLKQGSYMQVVGTIPSPKLLKVKEIYNKKWRDIEAHNAQFVADKYKQNSPNVNFKSNSPRYNDGGFEVTMVDGNTAKVGDVVAVRFLNGVFNGTIKAVAGRQDGQVTIVFRGRTKGRGVDPKNILRKIS